MKWFLLGLFFGFPVGFVGWVIKLITQQKARKRIEENLDTTLSEMAKSGKLRDFLDYLEEEEQHSVPKLDDLYYIYQEQEKKERLGKELQEWMNSL